MLIPLSIPITASRTCGPEEWSCQSGNGQCIPLAWVCDEHEDCDDASDEKVCSKCNCMKPRAYSVWTDSIFILS